LAVKALALVAVAACGSSASPPADGFIRDSDGRALVLRGVNLAGAHKNAPYTDAFGPADYTRLHDDWGMTAIRFLITWSAIEPSPGTFDDTYLDWVRERMGWAQDAGLSVIIDMHQDVYGEGFGFDGAPAWACDAANYAGFVAQQPWGINYVDPHVMACFDALWADPSELVAAWKHVGEYLADEPAIIGFDPINEPSWGSAGVATFEKERLNPFYESVIHAVRGAAPKWLAFVEPSNLRYLGFDTSLQPFAESGIVYAPHQYDVDAERTGAFDPSHAQAMVDMVAQYQAEAKRLHAALWIGEYGGNATDPSIGVYLGADYDGAAAEAAGSTYWAYDEGGGYSLLDPQGHEVPSIVSAVVRPAPGRVAGTPIDYSYDATTATFQLSYHPSGSAPTVIMVPPRLYPAGATIDCGGCDAEVVGSEVSLSHVTGDPAVITISR
jgi:endoglycosylceramidase